MKDQAAITPSTAGPEHSLSHGQLAWRRFAHNRLAVVGGILLLVLAASAVLAPVLSPHDPVLINPAVRLAPPSATYLLGTDEFGRDVLSRILYGGRISLQVAGAAVTLAMLIGMPLGLISGYYGRWVDQITSRFIDVLFSFPPLLLAVGLLAMLGASPGTMLAAIAVVYIPGFARVTRAVALIAAQAEFVQAARAIGASDSRIIVRHVLPNIMGPVIVQATLCLGYAILAESALSYLGLGNPPPTPSWGLMINSGKDVMGLAPWTAIFPGLAIMLTVLSLNLCGDGLRDALDPRYKD